MIIAIKLSNWIPYLVLLHRMNWISREEHDRFNWYQSQGNVLENWVFANCHSAIKSDAAKIVIHHWPSGENKTPCSQKTCFSVKPRSICLRSMENSDQEKILEPRSNRWQLLYTYRSGVGKVPFFVLWRDIKYKVKYSMTIICFFNIFFIKKMTCNWAGHWSSSCKQKWSEDSYHELFVHDARGGTCAGFLNILQLRPGSLILKTQ